MQTHQAIHSHQAIHCDFPPQFPNASGELARDLPQLTSWGNSQCVNVRIPSQRLPDAGKVEIVRGVPPLGINTRLRAASQKVLEKTAKNARFQWRFALQDAARALLPDERVAGCIRSRITSQHGIKVLVSHEYSSSHYGNVAVCGSVWTCPVCSSKISERRRGELSEAVSRWRAGGGEVAMMTFTMQHHAGESLDYVLDGIRDASVKFWQYRKGKELRARYSIAGRVRGLEVTHGEAGWHPHYHVLLFIDRRLSPSERVQLQQEAKAHWVHVLKKNARYASVCHGLDVRFGDTGIADYVAKFGKDNPFWTLEHEVTKSHVKNSRKGGRTPNALLADYNSGDIIAGELWREYAVSMKGKKQLIWTRGLRDMLGLGREKTDEQIAKEQEEDAVQLLELDMHQWRVVLANDARADVLIVARDGYDALVSFLRSLGAFDGY